MRRLYSKWTTVSDIITKKHFTNDSISVKGWVKSTRKMKDLIFIDIDDGSCASKLQIVIPKHMKQSHLTFGSSVEAEGKLKLNPTNNQLEILADCLNVVGTCDPTSGYPFAARKSYPDDYIRQFLHFRPRHSSFASIMRIRDALTRGLHDVLATMGFLMVHTPVLTSNDCEGAGEVFSVSPHSEKLKKEMAREGSSPEIAYFNNKAFLTVSGQLHLEAAVRGLSKVYTFGPVFRAENSRSRLHLSEFYMLEAEVAFSEDLEDAMILAENLCRKTITMTILQEHSSKLDVPPPQFGEPLGKEHELFLSQHMEQQCGQPMLFVLAFDLLGPVAGEVCGGSVREPSAVIIEQRLKSLENGESLLKGLQWYLDIRRHGNVPTSGFGLGFERFLQSLLGISNIKDTLPFPRWPHSLKM
ncbi:hypothetical protein B566_EDAN014154 [Ephemera danica]|nr:hypothetical protein B566_EDAN014154 [Ephemera danica]